MAWNNTLLIHEIIDRVSKAVKKADKIKILRDNESWALKDVLRGTFDTTIQWNLPTGEPPFTKNDNHSAPSSLLKEHKNFKYFLKGTAADNMPRFKRESIFVRILESIPPEEAGIVIAMVNKKQPAKGVTKNLVNEAFPGLIRE